MVVYLLPGSGKCIYEPSIFKRLEMTPRQYTPSDHPHGGGYYRRLDHVLTRAMN